MNKENEQATFDEEYWKGDGGKDWLDNIDGVESLIKPFNEGLYERAMLRDGDVVLDVGCGGGMTTIDIASRVGNTGRVVGVDIAPALLAVAQKRGTGIANVEFREADAGSADIGQGIFDLVTSRFGVMFFTKPVAAFANLRRALKPDGRLAMLCWQTLEENAWVFEPLAAISKIIPMPPKPEDPDPDLPGPFSLGTFERIQYVLGEAGFTAVETEPLDRGMCVGNIDQTLEFLTTMGPASKLFKEASEAQVRAGRQAIREMLAKYESDDRVVLPARAWIVTAENNTLRK